MKKVVHHFKKHYHERYVKPHGVRAHIILTIDGILVAIILGLLALGSYFAFSYNPLRDSFKIAFEIPELRSGETATIGVSVTNDSDETLEDFDITVFFPPQFQVYSTADTTESAGMLEIGSLGAGMTQSYLFEGLLLGPPSETFVYAKMRGQREFGEADERFASAPFVWTENAVDLSWNLPEAAVTNQSLAFSAKIQNDSAINFENVRFVSRFPERFRILTASPPAGPDGAFLGNLDAGTSALMAFAGRIDKDADEPIIFGGDLVWNQNGRDVVIASIEDTLTPVDVDVNAAVSKVPVVVRPGEQFTLDVIYANKSDKPLKDVRIRLPLDPQFIDIPASEATDGGRTDLHLAWESVTLPELEELAPGESGSLQAELTMRDPVASFDSNRFLELYPEITFNLDEPAINNIRISNPSFRAKVAGDAKLSGVARYFTNEGDQIGRGPLPPRVGAETKYWIVLKVDTASTAMRNNRVTIQLPENVKPTGRSAVTAGFDLQPIPGGLVWNIGRIEAFSGEKRPAPNASFEVALTPNSDQLGTEPILMKSASFTGTDAWTAIELESNLDELSTNLSTDPFIKGRTTVK